MNIKIKAYYSFGVSKIYTYNQIYDLEMVLILWTQKILNLHKSTILIINIRLLGLLALNNIQYI